MSKSQNICIRLHDDEPERWTEILRRALQRDPHANKSQVARALFRFAPYDKELLTEEDREFFRSRKKDSLNVVARAMEMPADLKASKGGRRKTG